MGRGPDISSSGGWARLKSNLAGVLGSTGTGAAGAGGSGLLGVTTTLPVIGTVGVPALAALAGAAVLLGAALAPVAAALIPITAGIAGFAFIAIPELTKVMGVLDLKGKAARKAMDALSPSERTLAGEIKGLKTQWGDLSKAVKPQVMQVFGAALKVIKDLMPVLKPLIVATAKAISKFLTQLSDWLESPQGQSFIKWLKTVGPKDIANFGRVLWDVAKVAGQVFNQIYRAGSWIDKLVTRLHEDWVIIYNSFRWFGDELVIFALRTVQGILTPFTHIPFIGKQFATARDAVHRELGRMVADAHSAANQITDAWDSIHAKPVKLNFDLNLPTGVHITSHGGEGRKTGHAAGTRGAAPGWAWTGERGPELVHFRGGETVLPSHVSMAVAGLPGYAAGVGYNIRDQFRPPVAVFDRRMQAAAADTASAIAGYVQKHFSVAGVLSGLGGIGGGPGGSVQAVARALFPWPAWMWPAFNAVEMREAGYSLTARNPSSGAYGVAQFINGPGEYFQYGGNPYTAAGQFTAMFSYIRQRYGTPVSAWAHELGYGWYDKGGWLKPGLSLAYNGTGRPEQVVPACRGGGATVTYNINVNTLPGGEREAGRKIVECIRQFESGSGASWRNRG